MDKFYLPSVALYNLTLQSCTISLVSQWNQNLSTQTKYKLKDGRVEYYDNLEYE